MLRKQKKTKEKKKKKNERKKSSICKIPREINTGKIWTQLLPMGYFKFFFSQINYEKVWDTLTALNFIVVIAKTVLKLFSFLALGDPDASLVWIGKSLISEFMLSLPFSFVYRFKV